MINISGEGLTSCALALHQSKVTDDTHRSQMEEDQRKLWDAKTCFVFFWTTGGELSRRRLTQQRQYSTVSSRHRGRADPPALTTLEKTCFAFWKPVLNNHCCEQMLCWSFSLCDHDSLYENILQDFFGENIRHVEIICGSSCVFICQTFSLLLSDDDRYEHASHLLPALSILSR